MLPNFLIIGAMKGGTTALYLYLRDHPDIFMSEMKEPNFFIEERNWPRGLAWYESLFEKRGSESAVGEASPKYTSYPTFDGVPSRIASLRPDMRLIYLVRHPIERMRSHYQHRKFDGSKLPPIDTAVLELPEFMARSNYATQIERYKEYFPDAQIKIVKTEDLRDDRTEVLSSIFEFLGVDPTYASDMHRSEYHVSGSKRRTRPTIERLRRIPAYKRVTGAVPLSMKVLLDRRTTLLREAPDRSASISPDVQDVIRQRFRDEIVRLRSYMDPGFDGWGIA